MSAVFCLLVESVKHEISANPCLQLTTYCLLSTVLINYSVSPLCVYVDIVVVVLKHIFYERAMRSPEK